LSARSPFKDSRETPDEGRMQPPSEPAAGRGPALAPDWDPERDLLVWIGAGGASGIPARARGKRAFLLVGAEARAAVVDGARTVAGVHELYQELLVLAGPPPGRALVHRDAAIAPELARAAAETVRNALRARTMQRTTVEQQGTTWILQGLANLPALARVPSITGLSGALAGRPCVLVSPGPSLSKNLGSLAALRERALIVSGTHALLALQRAGVAPHVVVCADPGDLSRHWAGVDLTAVDAFVAGATCRPEAFAVPARRSFAFASNGATDDWIFGALGESASLATGGSVSCSQLSLALHLGCDPIVFVGQDLSFTERFYAAESLDGDARVESTGAGAFQLVKPAGAAGPGTTLADGRLRFTREKPVLDVPGWNGGTVRTTPQLKAYLDWFEAALPAATTRARIMNCTEGGARIAGAEHRTLADATASWQPQPDCTPLLDRASELRDPGARRRALSSMARAQLAGLEECLRRVARCRELLPRAGADPSARERLGRAEKKLSQALRAALLVSLTGQAEITAAREAARRATDLAQNLAATRQLYDVVQRAGTLLLEPLRTACRALDG
jgi:hypothetical protein